MDWTCPQQVGELKQGSNPSVQFSRSVMSNSLWPHELQHTRPPCPSPTPGVHSNSRPSSWWCHPAISSSVVPFSSCPQSLPASESFPMSQLFAWGGQSTGVSALASFLPKNTQDWYPLEWTGWISLQSKGLSRVFSNTYIEAIVWVRGETFKAESETDDLWQAKWNKNQTVLATAIHTADRNAGPLEEAAAGSCSVGLVEQSQGESCCWLQRDGSRGCEGGDSNGRCLWRKARQPLKQGDTAESRVGGGAITIASFFPHASICSWNNREPGPSNVWRTELQSRTPPRVLL